MAEKEERILILRGDETQKCDFCSPKDKMICACCTEGISRQEAIEKMANAILRVQVTDAEFCCNTFAEAALNALLEDE